MKNDSPTEISQPSQSTATGNADELGIRLEPLMAPSRRHPESAGRCQGITRRDGQLARQCRRKARDGFPVCSHHGAGSRKRELAGVTKNPALARLRTGERAKPWTLEQLLRERPELRSLCEKNSNDNDVLDMRSVLARMRAITEALVTHADSCRCAEGEADAFIAIQALTHLVRALHDMLRIEERLGPITHAHVKRAMKAIMATIREFVPEDRRADALDVVRNEVDGGDQPVPELTEEEVGSWTREMYYMCQSASKIDPRSASNFDPR
jgi:hypothetical protein